MRESPHWDPTLHADELVVENAALRAERDTLQAQVAALQQQLAPLQELPQDVSRMPQGQEAGRERLYARWEDSPNRMVALPQDNGTGDATAGGRDTQVRGPDGTGGEAVAGAAAASATEQQGPSPVVQARVVEDRTAAETVERR